MIQDIQFIQLTIVVIINDFTGVDIIVDDDVVVYHYNRLNPIESDKKITNSVEKKN